MADPFEKYARSVLLILLPGILNSCTSRQVEDAAIISSVAVAAPVPVTLYGASYAAKAGYQNSSIVLHAPDSLYVEESQGVPAPNYAYSMSDSYMYMGSRKSYHYIMRYPVLGLRRVLKIPKDKLSIDNEFKLTSRSSRWRSLPPKANALWLNEEFQLFNICGFEIDPGLLQQQDWKFNEDQLYRWTNGEWLNVNDKQPDLQLITITNDYNGSEQ